MVASQETCHLGRQSKSIGRGVPVDLNQKSGSEIFAVTLDVNGRRPECQPPLRDFFDKAKPGCGRD